MKLELKRIRRDGGTQPRAKLLEDAIKDYAADMQKGDVFRPITVFFDGVDYWLADGFHRVEATLRLEPDGSIEAEVHQGTIVDAQWYSYSVNKTHGLRRTNEDKARAVRAALVHPHSLNQSDAAIAEHIGVHRDTVMRYRQELRCKTRQDGGSGEADCHFDLPETGKSNSATDRDEATAEGHAGNETRADSSAPNQATRRRGRDGRTINTTKIGRNSSGRRRRREIKISDKAARPIRGLSLPNPMIPLQFSPNNARTAAATLYREFTRDWCESLIQELTRFLSQQGGQA